MPKSLTAACWSFTSTDSVAENRDRIAEGVSAAAEAGAQLLLTPECALTGYPSVARADFARLDWNELAAAERELATRARDAGVALVLGTAGTATDDATNDALACGNVPAEVRYRKRCLTPLDKKPFVAGDEAVVAECAGWGLGLAICYDIRFPRVFAELARAGADAFLVIAHMAGPDPDPGTKETILPAHFASRAAEWATPTLLCNARADDRWLNSGCWDARGIRTADGGEGLLLATLTPRETLDPWYTTVRNDSLASFFDG
jgi:omega-amidase